MKELTRAVDRANVVARAPLLVREMDRPMDGAYVTAGPTGVNCEAAE